MPEEQNIAPPPEEAGEPKSDAPKNEPRNEPKKEAETTLGPKDADGASKQFNTTIGDIGVGGVGDNHTYNIHNVYGPSEAQIGQQIRQQINDVLREKFGEPESEDQRKKASARIDPFRKKLDEDIASSADGDDATVKTADLPKTDAELAKWYYELSAYDKCFVQAMAVFEGASVREITYATGKLYEPVLQVAALANSQQSPSPSSPKLAASDDISLSERMRRTHTQIRRVSRGSRLFWQDHARGVSQFKVRVLHFIAEEVHMWYGSIFLDQLQIWAEELTDENGPRAVQALGAIWWHEAERLQQIANIWTRDEKWYRAAYLLDGAYEVDRSTFGDAADDANKSPVLWLVQKWAKESRLLGEVNRNRGCAAALTYTLIGERSPALALRGLDSLLDLPQSHPQSQEEPEGIAEDVYAAVVLGYVDLAIYGQLREVLQHFARRLELISYRRLPLTEMKLHKRIHYRAQRQLQLIAMLDAFSHIANVSFQVSGKRDWVSYNLDKPLPSSISLTNNDGREILLVGILTGSSWREHISTLLCTALIEKLGDFAFAVLRFWADIVLKDQGPAPHRVRRAYVEFVVELGTKVRTWCNHLVALGFPRPSTPETFRNKLEKWQREGEQHQRPIGTLAQEILEQLP